MNIKRIGQLAAYVMVLVLFTRNTFARQTTDTLANKFRNPPASAMPRTWWHWIKSNVTKEGITKDLEWMKRVGIAGFQLSDVNFGSGQTVESKTVFGSPQWLEAVRYSASEAHRLGLEMAVFSSPGWSLTGGPWVKPEQAMKKLVWSEVSVSGGKVFSAKLPPPPSQEGPIRNLARGKNEPGFYKDCAVIAFRTPGADNVANVSPPFISSSSAGLETAPLLDDDLNTYTDISPAQKGSPAWVQFTYSRPFTVRAFTIAAPRGIPFGRLQASTDGKYFRTVAILPGKQGYRGGTVRTFSFNAITARFFRIELSGAPMKPADVISEAEPQADSVYRLSELKLLPGARINRWEDKAGFNFLFEYSNVSTPVFDAASAIKLSDMVNLSTKMDQDGTLNWKVPEGNWTIMRFGYSLTGAKNRPPVPAGLGYEVDKLSKIYTEQYLKAYTDPLKQALGPLYGNTLRYMMLDSWEAGIQNWTDEMITEFIKKRDYDPTLFLPALAGRIVGSAEISDRFLWDFRRTLVDLFAGNHYGTISDYLHKQGIQTYAEAGGVSLESIEDALLNKKYADIPMGEFWVSDLHPSSMYYEDVRGAASASHVYGKKLVAAEAYTGGNYESPYTLKKTGDYWFTQGVNRIVFHTSAHQPSDSKPGNTMVGTHINRNITWAELASPFITYLGRNSLMLQQGRYVADIAYLLTESAPSTMPFWGGGLQPAPPAGYQFDYINSDALISRMSVNNEGKLVLPDGLTYSVLVLPQENNLTVPLLKKIRDLIDSGATVVGPRPEKSPGLTGYPAVDDTVKALATELWGDLDGLSRTVRYVGKGKVIWGLPLEQVMRRAGIPEDLTIPVPANGKISWIHRKEHDRDIYFIVNGTDSFQNLHAKFRVSGREAELWHADSGMQEPAAYTIQNGFTIVPLNLDSNEAVFVVFNKKTDDTVRQIAEHKERLLYTFDKGWDLYFPRGLGAPEKTKISQPEWWTDNSDDGIRYFSGTATYSTSFDVKRDWLKAESPLVLDLGRLGDIAEVLVNGKVADTLWKAPYRTDISRYVIRGKNSLTVRVTNEWTNRLLGDSKSVADKKVLDAYIPPFRNAYQLIPSGLAGPVKLISIE